MSDKIITVTVRDKIARAEGRARVVCGNSDYAVRFDFDAEWAEYPIKTARFVGDGGSCTDVQFEGSDCAVPILRNTRTLLVGVFAGNLRTTTAALIHAVPCITDPDGTPADPTPDVYAQLMERFDKMEAPAAVLYTAQELTDEQKAAARENIGAEVAHNGAEEVRINVVRADNGREKTFTYYVTLGQIIQPAEPVSGDVFTAFMGLSLFGSSATAAAFSGVTPGEIKRWDLLRQNGYVSDGLRIISADARNHTKNFQYRPDLRRVLYTMSSITVSGEATYDIEAGALIDSDTHFCRFVELQDDTAEQFAMKSAPTEDMHIATKKYVDEKAAGGGGAGNAVLYTAQTLTDAQKEQARVNIGVNGLILGPDNGELSEADYNAIKSELDGAQNISLMHNRDVIQMQYWEMTGADSFALFFETTVISSDGGIVRKSYEVDISPSTIATTEHITPAADTSLGIATATVGQIAKITAVDDSGKPTAWEAGDMPSGGGGDLSWIEVVDITTAEQTQKLTISVDKDGRPLSQYNALWMVFSILFPADATQTSTNGTPWIYPLPKVGDSTYRYIANVAGWKTTERTLTYAWAGLPRITWSSAMAGQMTFGTTGTDGDPDFLSGLCVYLNSSSDHIPAGTRVRIAVLSKGVTA